jgi:hypothetical protein
LALQSGAITAEISGALMPKSDNYPALFPSRYEISAITDEIWPKRAHSFKPAASFPLANSATNLFLTSQV